MAEKTGKRNLYKSGLNRLIEWLDNKNWEVLFGNHYKDEMIEFDRTITISTKSKIENQLYACLHECGHLLIRQNSHYSDYYPNAFRIDSLPSKHKKLIIGPKYQVDLIAEEIDAWRKGKKLAKRLGIHINENNYNNEMSKYVFTYVKYAGKQ